MALTTTVLKWPHSLSGGTSQPYRTAFHTGEARSLSFSPAPSAPTTLLDPQDSTQRLLPPTLEAFLTA